MGTTQPVIARLESGRKRPSMRTLERLAEATGSRLLISFEPREEACGLISIGDVERIGI